MDLLLAVIVCLGLGSSTAASDVIPDQPEVVRKALRNAVAYLIEHASEARDEDEPWFGALPALVGTALYAAGDDEAFRAEEDWLWERRAKVTDLAGALLCLQLFSLDPPRQAGQWIPRRDRMRDWLEQLLREAYGIQPRRMNSARLGGASGGGGGRSRRAKPLDDTLGIALACAATRTAERVGFTTGPENERIPQAWAQIVRKLKQSQRRSGGFSPSSGGTPTRLSTAGGLLGLSLARTGLFHGEKTEGALVRQHANIDRMLEKGFAALEDDSQFEAESGEYGLADALTDVVLARLAWTTERTVGPRRQADLLATQAEDGSFHFADALPITEPRARKYYEQRDQRRLFCTSLAVLALTESARRADTRYQYSAFGKLVEQLRLPKANVDVLQPLVVADGSASWIRMTDELFSNTPAGEIARTFLVGHVGWPMGLGSAETEGDRDATRKRFVEWLVAEAHGWRNTEAWESQFGAGLFVLRGAETKGVLEPLAKLLPEQAPESERDLFRALRGEEELLRRATWHFLETLGAPESLFDPAIISGDNEAMVLDVEDWFRRRG